MADVARLPNAEQAADSSPRLMAFMDRIVLSPTSDDLWRALERQNDRMARSVDSEESKLASRPDSMQWVFYNLVYTCLNALQFKGHLRLTRSERKSLAATVKTACAEMITVIEKLQVDEPRQFSAHTNFGIWLRNELRSNGPTLSTHSKGEHNVVHHYLNEAANETMRNLPVLLQKLAESYKYWSRTEPYVAQPNAPNCAAFLQKKLSYHFNIMHGSPLRQQVADLSNIFFPDAPISANDVTKLAPVSKRR